MYSFLVLLIIASVTIVSAQQAAPGQNGVEIGRGTCGSQFYYAYTINCAIVSATPTMVLQVSVLRQISRVRCINGQNFGLTRGNTNIWVSNGCVAEFSIVSVGQTTLASTTTTSTPQPTTRTTLTTTLRPTTTVQTAAPTQASRAATTNANSCGQAGGNGFRIIGGTEATTCEFPWMVMIYNQQTESVCGGTILDSTRILTAAHCFFSEDESTGAPVKANANTLIVFSGSSTMPFGVAEPDGLVRRTVSEITTHENFVPATLENDIAILKLTRPIIFDACHKPLCMVDGSKAPQQATNCRTMGWGIASNAVDATAERQLKYVDIPVSTDDACRRIYGNLSSDRTFCAGTNGKDSCQGDSGGPFACLEGDGRYYFYGVVSAGISQNCGTMLGIYTKVSAYQSWISSKTQ